MPTTNSHSKNSLVTALRRKFKTPAAALAALGLDASILNAGDPGVEEIRRLLERICAALSGGEGEDNSLERETSERERKEETMRSVGADDDIVQKVKAFLKDELSPEAFAELERRIGGGRGNPAEDDPPATPGTPRPGGKLWAQDERLARVPTDDYWRRFPEAKRIGFAY